jgi:Flp pilus assembly protein TadG
VGSKMRRSFGRVPSCGRGERGTAMVETALVLPLFIVLLFGLIQWGFVMGARLTVGAACATAGRLTAIANPPLTDSELASSAREAVETMLNPSLFTATVAHTTSSLTGQPVTRVDCSYSLGLFMPLVVPGSSGGAITLRSSASAR